MPHSQNALPSEGSSMKSSFGTLSALAPEWRNNKPTSATNKLISLKIQDLLNGSGYMKK